MAAQEKVQAAKAAGRILDQVWTVDGEIPLPVDPVRIASLLGIEVYDETLEPDVSGAIVKMVGRDPVMLLNRSDSRNRKRFTCAHEIGHFVYHSNSLTDADYEYVDLRGSLAALGTDPDEVYANEFAAALLMPESLVREYFDKGMTPAEMVAKFRVSDDAMIFRLKNLGLSRT